MRFAKGLAGWAGHELENVWVLTALLWDGATGLHMSMPVRSGEKFPPAF